MAIDENAFFALQGRVQRLEDIVMRGSGLGGPEVRSDAEKKSYVRRMLDRAESVSGGLLNEAGGLLGLERSHAGAEPDESYERRIRAHVTTADDADATDPRPDDEPIDAANQEDDGANKPQTAPVAQSLRPQPVGTVQEANRQEGSERPDALQQQLQGKADGNEGSGDNPGDNQTDKDIGQTSQGD